MSKISKNNMFGAYLSELRKTKGKTQKKFAEEVHMSESTIAHYEQGRRTPDIETLIILADYFGVNIEYLLGRSAKFKGGIVNMCGNFSASVLYPFAAIRETSVCGYQCQGFPRSGACTLDTDIHICYNF